MSELPLVTGADAPEVDGADVAPRRPDRAERPDIEPADRPDDERPARDVDDALPVDPE